MKKKNSLQIALVVILIVVTLLISGVGAQNSTQIYLPSTITLQTEKNQYYPNEQIIINLLEKDLQNIDLSSKLSLELKFPQASSKYLGDLKFPLILELNKKGEFNLILKNKETKEIYSKKQLLISDENKQNITNITSSNISCEDLNFILDSNEIILGEKLKIEINNYDSKINSNLNLEIEISNEENSYKSTDTQSITFFYPKKVGEHDIILSCNEKEIARNIFLVLPNTNEEKIITQSPTEQQNTISTSFLAFFVKKTSDDVSKSNKYEFFVESSSINEIEKIESAYIIDFFEKSEELIYYPDNSKINNSQNESSIKIPVTKENLVNNYDGVMPFSTLIVKEIKNHNPKIIVLINGELHEYVFEEKSEIKQIEPIDEEILSVKIKDSKGVLNSVQAKILNKKTVGVDSEKSVRKYSRDSDNSLMLTSKQIQKEQKVFADIELNTNIKGLSGSKINLNSLEISDSQETILNIDSLEEKNIKVHEQNPIETFSMDLSNLNFTNGTFSKTAKGKELWKCQDWNYVEQTCYGSWVKIQDITPGKKYEIILSPQDPGYAETGLATINTNKPIYHVNETAEILVVVLNETGYLVSDANVTIQIISPQGIIYTINSENESIEEIDTGIYSLFFNNTTLAGSYNLNVYTDYNNMSSEFFVSDYFEFDIIRNSSITLDPWVEEFNTNIKISSFVNESIFTYKEILPDTFIIINSSGAIITYEENYLYLTWKNITNNSQVSYSAKIPQVSPELYLVQGQISYGINNSDIFEEARPWYLAADPQFDTPEAYDIALLPINETNILIAWIDTGDEDATFVIYNTTGSLISGPTDVDTDVGTNARIDVSPINSTHFLISWIDGGTATPTIEAAIYSYSGTLAVGPLTIDARIDDNGGNYRNDISTAQLGDKFAICWSDDQNNDGQARLFNNDGTAIGGLLQIDANMAPDQYNRNQLDCSGINSSRWLYSWFDDGSGDDIKFIAKDGTGADYGAEQTIHADAGVDGEVAIASLNNNLFGAIWFDDDVADQDISITIRDTANNIVLANTQVDSDAGGDSRVAASAVRLTSTSTTDSIVFAWWDSADSDIKVTIYDSNGSEILAPRSILTNVDDNYTLFDVVGKEMISGQEICPGRFIIGHTNSSNIATFEGFYVDGDSWDGECIPKDEPPIIKFNGLTPINGTLTEQVNHLFEFEINDTKISEVSFEVNGVNQTLFSKELVLMYNFDNVSDLDENDTYVVDVSGNENNGRGLGNAQHIQNGKYRGAFNFDGAGDYVEILKSESLDVLNYTFQTWFKTIPATSWTSNPAIMMRGDNYTSNELFVGFSGTTQDTILVIHNNGFRTFDGNVDLIDQQWHHLAVTFNSTTLIVYIDGQQYANPISITGDLDFGDSNLYLGTDTDSLNGGFGNYWNGQLDEVKLWNQARTATEILQDYQTDLYKFNLTFWNASINKTSMAYGDYVFQAHATDMKYKSTSTEARNLTISPDTTLPLAEYIYPNPDVAGQVDSKDVILYVNVTEENPNSIILDWNKTNSTIFDSSIVLWHNFDKVTSLGETDTFAVDITLYKNNATAVNDAIFNEYSSSFEFDGTGDYLEILSDTSLDVQNFTLQLKFKSQGTSTWTSDPALFMRGNAGGGNELFVGFKGLNKDTIQVILNEVNYDFNGGIDLIDAAWHNLSVVYNSTSLAVYVDGAQYSTPQAVSQTLNFGDSNAWIGADTDAFNANFGNYWNGSIDEVRLFNTPLTITQLDLFENVNITKYDFDSYIFSVSKLNQSLGTYEYNLYVEDIGSNIVSAGFRNVTLYEPLVLSYNPATDIDIAALDPFTLVFAQIDSVTTQASFEIWYANKTRIVDKVILDATGDSESRIAIAPINASRFAIGIIDGPEDDVDVYIYDSDGTQVLGATELDNNVGVNNDISLTQLGSKFAVCDSNDNDNDADFRLLNNDGSVAVGELNVDGNIGPEALNQNLIDCSAINSSAFVYLFFDDSENDATFSIVQDDGTILYIATDLDINVGETGQVAVTGLRNNRFAMAYYDSASDELRLSLREYSIYGMITILDSTIATNVGGDTRLEITEIENGGESYFAVVWQNATGGNIMATVYDYVGNLITEPFVIEYEEHTTNKLIGTAGYNSVAELGLCDQTFAVAYTNSSGVTRFRTLSIDGNEWHGLSCDKTPPTINFIAPTLDNGSVSNITDVIANISIGEDSLKYFTFYWQGINTSIYDENLLLMYNFDNVATLGETSTNFVDLSIYGNDGTGNGFEGDELITLGNHRGAVDLDGTNDNIDAGDINEIDGASELTISLWIKADDLTDDGVILAKDAFTATPQLIIWRDEVASVSGRNNTLSVSVSDGTDTAILEGAENLLNDNLWHQIVVVFNKTDSINGLRLFVDGIEDSHGPVSTVNVNGLSSNANSLFIGRPTAGSNLEFDGSIDELKIYKTAFSTDQIDVLYKSNFNKYTTSDWYFELNKSSLPYDNYYYQGFASDSIGNKAQTDLRVTILAPDPNAPEMSFVSPTYPDDGATTNRYVVVNVSIIEENLASLLYDWNNTNYSIFDKDLISLYNFDNVSSLGEKDNIVRDVSQYGGLTTVSGTPYFNMTGGRRNGAIQLDGYTSSSYIRNDNVSQRVAGKDITIMAWINSASLTQQFFQSFNDVSGNNKLMFGSATGDSSLRLFDEGAGGWQDTNVAVIDGTWHHVGYTLRNATNATIYVDGFPVYEYNTTSNILVNDRFVIGMEYDGASAGDFWNGKIDELRIWNRSLTNDEYLQQYNTQIYKYDPDKWIFEINETNLSIGSYTYQAFSADVPTSSSFTEKRTVHIFDYYTIDYTNAIDIDMAAIDNTTIAVVWIDSEDFDAALEIWDTNGTRRVVETKIDTDGNAFSRIAIAPISNSEFAIFLIDGPSSSAYFFIYDIYGDVVKPRTLVDSNVGTNSDAALTQLGDRFVTCYANDNDNDADFQIWSNTGSNLVGETNVAGNIAPGSSGQNLIDCVSIGSGNWVYGFFDDNANDATVSARDETGIIYQTQDLDTDVGEVGQIALAGLRNNRFASVFYDSVTAELYLTIRALSGASITPILANTVIDSTLGGTPRVSAAEIENSGASYFVVTWQDLAQGSIKAAVYDDSGNQYTAPFNVTNTQNNNYLLIDAVGYVSAINLGLCDESFAVAYSNSSNKTTFKTFKMDGSEWDGICELDVLPPEINLTTPLNGVNFSELNVNFTWFVTDNKALNISCDLIIDDVVRSAGNILGNNTSTSVYLDISNGDHYWNVTCSDEEGNSNTSGMWKFNVNVPLRFNNVTLDDLGTLGTMIYADSTNVGTPLQRNWTGLLGEEEIIAPDLGQTISWQKFVCSKVNPECYLVALKTDNSIDFVVFDLQTRTWYDQTQLVSNRGLDDYKSFDIACEDDGVSEECIIAFEWSNVGDDALGYVIWNGTGLSSQYNYSFTGAPANDFRWISLYPQKATNTIALVAQNDEATSDLYAAIWNGNVNTFENEILLTDVASGTDTKQYDCAWEGSSGELLCAYGLNSDDIYAHKFIPSTNTWNYQGDIYAALNAQAREIVLCGESPYTQELNHNFIGLMSCDQDADRDGGIWDGNTFSKSLITDMPAQDTDSECGGNQNTVELSSQSCSFEKNGEKIVFVWVDANENFPEGGYYDISNSYWSFNDWGTGVPIGVSGNGDVGEVQLVSSPFSDEIFLIDQDESEDLSCAIWTGRSFESTDCGDFEGDGPILAQGAYISYDWLRFNSQPNMYFINPTWDKRVYNFTGAINPSYISNAYSNLSTNLPPTAALSPMQGIQATNDEYNNISSSDDAYFSTTISTITGERVIQSFKFEIEQSPQDIYELKIFYEGYVTATTFQTADTFYVYVYNYSSDSYDLLRTVNNVDLTDLFTEITLTNTYNFSELIVNGNLYVLIQGDHQTAFGGDARADINTDYIDVVVTSKPNIRGNQTVNIYAYDDNGINYCEYYLANSSGDVSGKITTDDSAKPNFINYTDTTLFSNGEYYFNATCEEYFGVISHKDIDVIIDNTNPFLNLVNPTDGNISTTNNVSFSWNGTDNSNGILFCDIYLDGGIVVTNALLESGNTVTDTVYNISDGVHTWNVGCKDVAGNSFITATWDITVDAGGPTVTLNSPLNNTLTNNNSVLFNYTPFDALGLSSCSLILNGAINYTNSSIINGANNYFLINDLPDADYVWAVNCSDLSLFVGPSEYRNLTIDKTPADIQLNTADAITFTQGIANLNFTATDLLSTNLTCNITIEGIVEDENVSVTSGVLTSRNLSLPDGNKYWNVTCIDEAGNINTSETRSFTLEGPPYIEVYTPIDYGLDKGVSVDFKYFVQDGDGIQNCSIYFDDALNYTDLGIDLDNPGNNTFTLNNLALGSHVWFVNCFDLLGFESNSTQRTLYIDQSPPLITLNSPENNTNVFDSLIDFSFTPTDNYGSEFICNLTIDNYVDITNENISALNASTKTINQTLSNGDHYWNITCMDYAGNINTSLTRKVSVVAPINVTVIMDKTEYQEGAIAQINISTKNATGGPVNSSVQTDVIYSNQSLTGAPWWNTAWDRRIPLKITQSTNYDTFNDIIFVNVTNLEGRISNCNNEIRIIHYEKFENYEQARNILGGDNSNYCEIEFAINLSAQETSKDEYFIYYNNTGVLAPTSVMNLSSTYVQRDIIIATGGTILDFVQSVNPTKSILLFTANTGSSNPDQSQFTSNITSSNIISFERYNGATQTDISWQLIEHKDINVQRGSASLNALQETVTANINEVNLSHAFIIVDGRTSSGSAGYQSRGYFRAEFVNETTIILKRTNTGSTATVSWQVVEWPGANVQTGELNIPDTTAFATINPINISTSFLIFGKTAGNDTGLDANHVGGKISSSTQVDFTRTVADGDAAVRWYVVELPQGTYVQRGITALSGDVSVDISSVIQNKSFHVESWYTTGGGTTYTNAMVMTDLASESSYNIDKETTSQTNTVEWEVIQLPKYALHIINQESNQKLITRYNNYTNLDENTSLYFNTTFQLQGNYSSVTSATAPGFSKGVGYDTFAISSDFFGPEITLISPANETAGYTMNVTITYDAIDYGTTIDSCSLIINDQINQTDYDVSEENTNEFYLTNLGEGKYYWTIKCTDYLGNTNQPSPWVIIVDETNPFVTAYSPNETTINSLDVEFNFSVIDNIDDLLFCNISLNNGTYSATTYAWNGTNTSVNITSIAEGKYYWDATCYDDVNNSHTSYELSFNMDSPPQISLDSPGEEHGMPPGSLDFFYFVTEGNLSNCSLLINGTVNQTKNASEILYVDSSNTNNFTINYLEEGLYYWNVECIDINGFVGNATDRELQVDTQAPNITLYSPFVNQTFYIDTIPFNFTAYDNIDPLLTCNVTVNDIYWISDIAATNGNETIAIGTGFTAGNYTWNVTCWDNTGYINTSESRFFNISAEVFVVLNSPDYNSSDADGNVTLQYTPSSVAGFDSGGFCVLLVDGLNNQTDISINNGEINEFNLTSLSEGWHSWQINCTDDNAFFGESEIRSFIVDLQDPQITANYPNGDLLTSSVIEFNWTATDNLANYLLCNISVNNTLQIPSEIVSWNGSDTLYNYSGFTDGYHIWNATCSDAGARVNTSLTLDFTVQEVPAISLDSPFDGYRTNIVSNTFFFTPTDNSLNISLCSLIINDTVNETSITIIEGIQNNISAFNFPDGRYTWAINCTDPSGNEGTNISTRNITIDLTPPDITLNAPIPNEIFNQNNVVFNWTPIDAYGVDIICNVTLDDSINISGVTGYSADEFTIIIENISEGPHNWSIQCSDDLNNSNTSETRDFIVNSPDLIINNSLLSLNDSNPNLGDTINISSIVYNFGGITAENALIEFWDGPPSTGILIGNNTLNISINGSEIASYLWNITSGYHEIWVIADPYETMVELNDSNNNGSINISVLSSIIVSPLNNTATANSDTQITFNLTDYTGGTIDYSVFVDNVANGQIGSVTDSTNNLLNVTLTQGTHTIIVEANDSLSRKKNSTALTRIVDLTDPVPIIQTLNQTWFVDNTPEINFTITDAIDLNLNYTIYINGSIDLTGNVSSGILTSVNLSALTNGTYEIIVEGLDDVGHYANSTPIIIYVDTISPTVTLNEPINNSNFSVNSVNLNFTVTDNLAIATDLLICDLILDGSYYAENISLTSGILHNIEVTDLNEGVHYWNVTCQDPAANTGVSETWMFNVFSVPILTLLSPANATWSNLINNTVFFNVSDETGLENCSLIIDGVINQTKTTNSLTLNGTNNLTATNLNGTHIWAVECYDNTTFNAHTISESRTLFVDLENPLPIIVTTNNTWFNTATPQIDFNITDNVANTIDYVIYVNGTPNVAGSVYNGTPSLDELTGLSNGTYSLILEGTDLASNSFNSSEIIIYIDTVLPTITLLSPLNNSNSTNPNQYLNFTVSDNMAGYLVCDLTLDENLELNNVNITSGYQENYSVSGLSGGYHYWNVTCIDLALNTQTSDTWVFYIFQPDISVNSSEIYFNTTTPFENETVNITATIRNLGNIDTPNFIIQFFNGDPENGGVQIGSNIQINLTAGQSINVSTIHNLDIGNSLIYVAADTPLATNGTVVEENELNNKAYSVIVVGLWNFVFGTTQDKLVIRDVAVDLLFDWNVGDSSGSNLFAVDQDSVVSWTQLQALGQNISNETRFDDFNDLDVALGSENFTDSVNITYTSAGAPIGIATFDVFSNTINNVPVINSTNNTNFETGILWDYSDGGVEYDGSQDVIFITELKNNLPGYNGNNDYEIRVPALLREYAGPGTANVDFYIELK